MPIQQAVRTQRNLRIGLGAPTGAGKTLTGLKLAHYFVTQLKAKGIDAKIGVVDTENFSASVYAPHEGKPATPDSTTDPTFDFDTFALTSFAPDRYIEAIEAFEASPTTYVMLIDSVSHAWMGKDGALRQVDSKQAKGGNKFAAWRDVSPQHDRLVEKLVGYRGHLIATLRSKMEYAVEKDDQGNSSVKKLGMAPQMRDGIEYEFDHYFEIDQDHNLITSKTRAVALDGYSVNRPGLALADVLWRWATGDGAELPPEPERQQQATAQQESGVKWPSNRDFMAELSNAGFTTKQLGAVVPQRSAQGGIDLNAWKAANPDKGPMQLLSAVADHLRVQEEAAAAQNHQATARNDRQAAQEPATPPAGAEPEEHGAAAPQEAVPVS